jgi:hypothetical protein
MNGVKPFRSKVRNRSERSEFGAEREPADVRDWSVGCEVTSGNLDRLRRKVLSWLPFTGHNRGHPVYDTSDYAGRQKRAGVDGDPGAELTRIPNAPQSRGRE